MTTASGPAVEICLTASAIRTILDFGECVVDLLFEAAFGDAFVAGVPVGLDDPSLNGAEVGRNESESPDFQDFEQLVDGEDRGGRGNVVGAFDFRTESLVALEAGPRR